MPERKGNLPKPTVEYKVIAALLSDVELEERLNQLAAEGWRVVAMNGKNVILERVL